MKGFNLFVKVPRVDLQSLLSRAEEVLRPFYHVLSAVFGIAGTVLIAFYARTKVPGDILLLLFGFVLLLAALFFLQQFLATKNDPTTRVLRQAIVGVQGVLCCAIIAQALFAAFCFESPQHLTQSQYSAEALSWTEIPSARIWGGFNFGDSIRIYTESALPVRLSVNGEQGFRMHLKPFNPHFWKYARVEWNTPDSLTAIFPARRFNRVKHTRYDGYYLRVERPIERIQVKPEAHSLYVVHVHRVNGAHWDVLIAKLLALIFGAAAVAYLYFLVRSQAPALLRSHRAKALLKRMHLTT